MQVTSRPRPHGRLHPPPARPRVLVVSDQPLVADAVRTALHSQDLEAVGATMPSGPATRRQLARLRQVAPDVVLVIADLARGAPLTACRSLVSQLGLPTVVLAETEDEALWGAVLASGATAVVPASATLQETVLLLHAVRAGDAGTSPRRREGLVRLWRQEEEVRSDLAARLDTLSPRERDVLHLLYRGQSVRTIAARSGVAVVTVRSHVRSIRRKLGVGSQLAAVSVYSRSIGSRPDGETT